MGEWLIKAILSSFKEENPMKYNLHLLKNFNNYYNRQLIKFDTLNDYLTNENFLISFNDRNFDFQDGLFTKHIVNYSSGTLEVPDYCIVEDKDTNEFSRWFVIECRQTRGYQYELSLKRDIIAEHYEVLKASPCLIKKGYVDNSSTLVFNKEPQEYNKIKKSEHLIKDQVGTGWVIGFIERDKSYSGHIKASYYDDRPVDFDYSALPTAVKQYMGISGASPIYKLKVLKDEDLHNIGIQMNFTTRWNTPTGTNINVYEYTGQMFTNVGNYRGKYYFNVPGFAGDVDNNYCKFEEEGYINTPAIPTHLAVYQGMAITYNTSTLRSSTGQFAEYYSNKWHDGLSSISLATWWNHIPEIYNTYTTYQTLKAYDGKICQIDGNYYRCQIVRNNSTQYQNVAGGSILSSSLYNAVVGALPTDTQMQSMQTAASYSESPKYYTNYGPSNLQSSDFGFYYFIEDFYINLVQENIQVWTDLTTPANRNHLVDAPYDMFAIPYANEDFTYSDGTNTYNANKNMAINMAIEICRSLGSTAAYDIQIVPFCPLIGKQGIQSTPMNIALCSKQPIRKGTSLTTSDPIVGYYLWCDRSSYSFSTNETRDELTLNNSELTYKEITQMNEYILCSPAKDSTYEFNPAMNRGIHKWNISFDYRPYSSYIKVQPDFDYLYGSSSFSGQTDVRGLIFNGNYSITQLSNAWAEYMNSNKNYQQIFDTQVDTQINKFNKQQKAQWDTVGARNWSINPVKTVLGIIGESKQMDYDREIFNMDISAQREIFNYQLDNIKSKPDAISKLTSLNIDFRIYPYVEIYSTNDSELQFFRDNMKWNGMTIMVTGYIEQYLKPAGEETFVQATIIRYNENIKKENDYTLVSELNKELDMGVYITK